MDEKQRILLVEDEKISRITLTDTLRKEGYDLEQVEDPMYVLKPRSDIYEPLDAAFASTLQAGKGGY